MRPMTPGATQRRDGTRVMSDTPVIGRGPEPPFLVCPECGAVSETPWTNPLRVWAKKHGLLPPDAEVTGGIAICDACFPNIEKKFKSGGARPVDPAGIPLEFKGKRLSEYQRSKDNERALGAASSFLTEGATHDLFIFGPVGTGKTRLAAAIAYELMPRYASVAFARVHVLMRRLQDAMSPEGAPATVTDWVNPSVLVLDDVGAEKGSDYSRRTLQTIYDMRRDAGGRTIWTSNLNLEELSVFLEDDRLSSRIAGAADVVFLGGEDQRAAGFRRQT